MQSIPRGENIWGNIGTSLGELAGAKLAQIVGEKRKEKERSQFKEMWKPYLGDEKAHFLSNLEPEERKHVMQNLESLMQLQQVQQQQPQQNNILASLQGPQQQGMQQPQQFSPQQELQSALQHYFNNPTLGGSQNGLMSLLSGSQHPEQQMPQQQQFYGQQMPEQQEEGLTPERAKLVQGLFETPQQKLARQKEERENKKLALVERRENAKETKGYIDALKNKEKAAKEADLRLKRMEKLIDQGKLPNAGFWSFLSKIEDAPLAGASAGAVLGSTVGTAILPGIGTAIGGGIGTLVGGLTSPLAGAAKSYIKTGSPDIEEFEKLSNEFVKNAKQYFGSRITQKEVEMFMQTVPTLLQTDAGKKKIIENIRSLNELIEIEAKAARSIIKDNNGITPVDIEQQVQDRISKKLDRVAQKFIVR